MSMSSRSVEYVDILGYVVGRLTAIVPVYRHEKRGKRYDPPVIIAII